MSSGDLVADNIIRYIENNPSYTYSGTWGVARKQRFRVRLPPNKVLSRWITYIAIDEKIHVCEDTFDAESRIALSVVYSTLAGVDFSYWYIRDDGDLYITIVYEKPLADTPICVMGRCLWSI